MVTKSNHIDVTPKNTTSIVYCVLETQCFKKPMLQNHIFEPQNVLTELCLARHIYEHIFHWTRIICVMQEDRRNTEEHMFLFPNPYQPPTQVNPLVDAKTLCHFFEFIQELRIFEVCKLGIRV